MSHRPRGLSALPEHALRRLRDAVRGKVLAVPLTDAGLRAAGFGLYAAELMPTLDGLSAGAIAVVAEVALAERAQRKPPQLRLVWTGPEGEGATARETAMLVCELFESARQDVLVAGFAFDHGAEIFAPLHRAMVEHAVRSTIFLDIVGHAPTAAGAKAHAEHAIARFIQENWPFGAPYPAVYYDPRTAAPGPPWVSLHAKCIVVDARKALVTSANFTERGQARNIELGVLIDDEPFAAQVLAQWWGLVPHVLERYVVAQQD